MSRLDPGSLDGAFAVMRQHAADGRVPFTMLAVADREGIIRRDAVTAPGRAEVPIDAQCLIASITKSIVATLAMRLHQDGRFALDAPLALWLPELAVPEKRAITAWHVLTHTTGFEDPWLDRIVAENIAPGRGELLTAAMSAPLANPVGSTFLYATVTFDLLAVAIERALGRPFEALLREQLLDPLGMRDTDWEPEPARAAPVEVLQWVDDWRPGDRLDAPTVEPVRRRLVGLHLAGAGLHSTLADLVRFGRAMLRDGELDGVRVLAPAFVRLMTRAVTIDGLGRQANRMLDDRYALGWGTRGPVSPMSARAFAHGGATGTRLLIDPEHDLVVVHLTGLWAHPGSAVDEIVNAVYASMA